MILGVESLYDVNGVARWLNYWVTWKFRPLCRVLAKQMDDTLRIGWYSAENCSARWKVRLGTAESFHKSTPACLFSLEKGIAGRKVGRFVSNNSAGSAYAFFFRVLLIRLFNDGMSM
ncbi:hypothetical protein TNIN_451391 [Trichonephila inaurata madagascariensis]|uniref:Uncharacterized protein n=1 Tax=Trichonephila inaurata madagascariensis TaxID=2747483 RepID=A0A8X6YZS7_9ARAC|nr:hypothetical protein TNIN_451391 [Trichonephila inaurata madagascariensis]